MAMPSFELRQALARLPAPARVLDWGCGRGRMVLHLRDVGVEAWGVDIDNQVLARADAALARRGLADACVLRLLGQVANFPDGYFNLIFSEETLEHVVDLEALAADTFRLTAPGGIALHSFPGRLRWREPHLMVPLVHWWPDGAIRNAWLRAALCIGSGPYKPWPETLKANGQPLPLAQRVRIYADYLREKVHYRSVDEIVTIFENAGFQVSRRSHLSPRWCSIFPIFWRRKGFPAGNLLLELRKPR